MDIDLIRKCNRNFKLNAPITSLYENQSRQLFDLKNEIIKNSISRKTIWAILQVNEIKCSLISDDVIIN
jgi:hypothetical protein